MEDLIECAKEAIAERGTFTIACSGGTTPKQIFKLLATPANKKEVDWEKVHVFFSDERCVLPTSDESNYKSAMDSGISALGIPPKQIYRILGEIQPEESAEQYEKCILEHVDQQRFDVVMAGMGLDGHTVSLFPETKALEEREKLVVANYVPQKECWRITFTFPLIHKARNIRVYILGKSKQEMVNEIFTNKNADVPITKLANENSPPLFILDGEAAEKLPDSFFASPRSHQ